MNVPITAKTFPHTTLHRQSGCGCIVNRSQPKLHTEKCKESLCALAAFKHATGSMRHNNSSSSRGWLLPIQYNPHLLGISHYWISSPVRHRQPFAAPPHSRPHVRSPMPLSGVVHLSTRTDQNGSPHLFPCVHRFFWFYRPGSVTPRESCRAERRTKIVSFCPAGTE